MNVRVMTAADYAPARALWETTEGVGLGDSDGEAEVAAYLRRNAGMSAVALDEGAVIGAVLCGTDGRRGYLHHLAVAKAQRRRGVAKALLAHCFAALAAEGIPRCNIFVFADNHAGQEFWLAAGWKRRPDLLVMQKPIAGP
jgi:ribosomal protein S18 acetylase RimI-like enzyme